MNRFWVVFCVVVVAAGFWGGSASAGLIDYWSFNLADDDGSGHPRDLVGGHTAIQSGPQVTTPPTRTAGADGTADGAAKVSGSTSGGASGYMSDLKTITSAAGTPFSYEAMFRFDANAYNWNYLTNRSGGGPLTMAQYISNKRLTVNVGATAIWTNATGPVWNTTAGSWWDIALTYDGTTLNLYLTPYSPTATPVLAASTTNTTLIASSLTGLGFGGCDSSRYGVTGYYDWAAVFDHALTADEIAAHIAADNPGYLVPEPSTLALVALLGAAGLLVCARRRRAA